MFLKSVVLCVAELVCVGHLRLPSAVLQTPRQPAVLETEASLASEHCSVSYSGQRLLTAGIAATRIGTPSDRSKQSVMHSQTDSVEQLLRPSTKAALTECINTAGLERDAGGCWEGSCCMNPLQLEIALHLAALDMNRVEAVALSQAAAISMTGANSSPPSAGITAIACSTAAAAGRPPSCIVTSAFMCGGVVMAAAGAAANGEHHTMALQTPMADAAALISRRNTGLAGSAGLRRLPRAARLLRIEALVRLRFPR